MKRAARDLGELTAAGNAAGSLVVGRAASRAPKLTGRLAASISYEAAGNEVSIGSPLVYAPVIEYGSPRRGIAAQPFLRSSLDESSDRIVTNYEVAVGGVVASIEGY